MNWSLLHNTDQFQRIICDQYKKHFELVRVKRRPNDKPWMNDQIRRLLMQRDFAFKQNGNHNYRYLRNKVQRMIRAAKHNFYQRKIEHLKKSEPGKWHMQIRHLIGQKKQSVNFLDLDKSPAEIAHYLNVHFPRICSCLPSLDLSLLTSYLPASSSPPPQFHASRFIGDCSN